MIKDIRAALSSFVKDDEVEAAVKATLNAVSSGLRNAADLIDQLKAADEVAVKQSEEVVHNEATSKLFRDITSTGKHYLDNFLSGPIAFVDQSDPNNIFHKPATAADAASEIYPFTFSDEALENIQTMIGSAVTSNSAPMETTANVAVQRLESIGVDHGALLALAGSVSTESAKASPVPSTTTRDQRNLDEIEKILALPVVRGPLNLSFENIQIIDAVTKVLCPGEVLDLNAPQKLVFGFQLDHFFKEVEEKLDTELISNTSYGAHIIQDILDAGDQVTNLHLVAVVRLLMNVNWDS